MLKKDYTWAKPVAGDPTINNEEILYLLQSQVLQMHPCCVPKIEFKDPKAWPLTYNSH
jgi:hypothetical protein